jgi:type IV pilus assembly protein PilO
MTFADDLPFEKDEFEAESQYPTVFGLTVTPVAGGILFAIAGIVGAAALGWYVVRPAMENLNTMKAEVESTENQILEQERLKAQISSLTAQLQQAQRNQQEILGLFGTEEQLNTLLLDLNRQVESRQGEIVRYSPGETTEGQTPGQPTVLADATWGEGVQGKLKTQTFNMEVKGTFAQTLSILRGIEQLQTLVAIQNFQTQYDSSDQQTLTYDRANNRLIPADQPTLQTTFTLQTLVPLSSEELVEQAQAAAEAPPEGEQPPQ